MKKIIAIVLLFCLTIPICFAEFNYNYSEVMENEYSELNYKEYSRTMTNKGPEEYVYFTGKVIQVTEISSVVYLRVATDGYADDVVMCSISIWQTKLNKNILEDDEVLIFGKMYGKYSYESVLGAEVTIPFMFVEIVELIETSEIIYNKNNLSFSKIEKETINTNSDNTGRQVIVPAGFYKVGEDIPAGEYCIEAHVSKNKKYVYMKYGTKINSYGNDFSSVDGYTYIYNPNYSDYEGGSTFVNITLTNGTYISFDNEVIFTIGKRKISLGF